jgi:hypothetical protein
MNPRLVSFFRKDLNFHWKLKTLLHSILNIFDLMSLV